MFDSKFEWNKAKGRYDIIFFSNNNLKRIIFETGERGFELLMDKCNNSIESEFLIDVVAHDSGESYSDILNKIRKELLFSD